MLDDLHLNPDLIQRPFIKHGLGAETREIEISLRGHENAVGHRCQVIRSVGEHVSIGVDEFPAFLEIQ